MLNIFFSRSNRYPQITFSNSQSRCVLVANHEEISWNRPNFEINGVQVLCRRICADRIIITNVSAEVHFHSFLENQKFGKRNLVQNTFVGLLLREVEFVEFVIPIIVIHIDFAEQMCGIQSRFKIDELFE